MIILFKNRCYNGGNKHKFVARYTERDRGMRYDKVSGVDVNEYRNLLTLREYQCDVCEWCGKIITR